MLEEKHRIHKLQINYINSLNERITCLQRDVEFLKSDISLKNEVIKCFLEQIRGGIKDAVKSPNSSNGSTSVSNSEIVDRSSSLLEEPQSNTDDTYTLVQNGSIPTKSVDRNLSPTFVSLNPYRYLVDDDEMNFEEVVRVHVPSPKTIHHAIPDKNQTNKNSHIHFNNHPENDKQLYPRESVPGISSYLNVPKESKKVCIYSDSIIKRMDMIDFNDMCKYNSSLKRSFPGCTADSLC